MERRNIQPTDPIRLEVALEIKSEVMSKLKQRLLSRAEIIQNRISEETQNLNQKIQEFARKGELATKKDEED